MRRLMKIYGPQNYAHWNYDYEFAITYLHFLVSLFDILNYA